MLKCVIKDELSNFGGKIIVTYKVTAPVSLDLDPNTLIIGFEIMPSCSLYRACDGYKDTSSELVL